MTQVEALEAVGDKAAQAAALIAEVLAEASTPCVTSSFQSEDVVLVDLVRRVKPDIPVLFLETFHHFPQTLTYRDEIAARWNLNLINLFGFYLAAMFLLGTLRRFEQYRAIGGIMVAAPGRWPRLLKVMKEHRAIFLTWSTLRPAGLALLLCVVHMIASRAVWPQAHLTAHALFDSWLIPPLIVMTMIPMLAVDVYFLVRVGRIDRVETEYYLDVAEAWLTGWKAAAVRTVTFGAIDPRRKVSEEVQKALSAISNLINRNLYWMSLQVGLRVVFGLTLWLTWAWLTRPES